MGKEEKESLGISKEEHDLAKEAGDKLAPDLSKEESKPKKVEKKVEKKKPVANERKISIIEFIEDFRGTGNSQMKGASFQMWWLNIQKNTGLERKTLEEWNKTYKKFLNRKIK